MDHRTCKRCGKPFIGDNGHRGQWQRFCSSECREARPKTEKPTCIIDGCAHESRSIKQTYCEMHYYRLRRTGGLETSHTRRERRGVCIVADCSRSDCGPAGYCAMHQLRITRNGSPHIVMSPGPKPGPTHPSYKGDAARYGAIHARLKSWIGPATDYACIECGEQAKHWSYDHLDPDEHIDAEGPFSTDLLHYQPRCVACHKVYDLQFC